ncbi:MAG: N-acetylmuramic acid 6-phosphate etherase [Lachnospiraceae bacterium]|nr:N-acetylmuramic acid 6-phosphate etherase [Lachnospiraceae bacterium]
MVNIDGLTTETVNEATRRIDEEDALGIVTLINQEDKKVAEAVEKELPRIAKAVDAIAARFEAGGRIIYCGAGSSGRIGALDAAELTPTYGVPMERAFGILAGGQSAMFVASEGAEDSKELAVQDLKAVDLKPEDCVISLAASGRTPYAISAVEYGKQVGALTIAVTCNGASEMAGLADISIAPVVGAEAISGSTRMKAGTAQKMVLNMLSTGVMVRLGKVYQNYMVHMQPTNEKLVVRAIHMISAITGADSEKAQAVLEQADRQVAVAVVMLEADCGKAEAVKALEEASGRVRKAIAIAEK